MKAYYKNMYNGVESIRFDFKTNAKNDEIYFFVENVFEDTKAKWWRGVFL